MAWENFQSLKGKSKENLFKRSSEAVMLTDPPTPRPPKDFGNVDLPHQPWKD